MNVYAPKLTKADKKQYAFALQSLRGETQSADSFMRFLWPFGGSLLDKDFKSNLLSPESQAGLKFRQDLMKYMPPGIVSYDHAEAVNALAQGQVAMITEWSAFYGTLTDPKTSKLGDCLAVAPEPQARPAGCRRSAASRSRSRRRPRRRSRRPSWLFIQWATSEAIAQAVCRGRRRLGPHGGLQRPGDPGQVQVREADGRVVAEGRARISARASRRGRRSPRSWQSSAAR